MRISGSYYKNLLDKLDDGICCVDLTKRVVYWNKAAKKIMGFPIQNVLDKMICSEVLSHTDESGRRLCGKAECPVEQVLAKGVPQAVECYIRHRHGRKIPVSLKIEPVHDSKGRILGAVQIFHDNTAKILTRTVIEKLKNLALLDPLTGLANRRYIERILRSRLDELKRYNFSFGVLFIDIDHFKTINDRYGHEVGDKVLQQLSRNISGMIRSSDVLGRWGGEEFVAIILNVDRKQLHQVAEKLRSYVEKLTIRENGHLLKVTVSIGAVLADSKRSEDNQSILKRADELMYLSKINGRNRVTVDPG